MGNSNPYPVLVTSPICAACAAGFVYFNVRLAKMNLARGGVRPITWLGLIVSGTSLILFLAMFRSSLQTVRRLRRRSTGRCVECGYDLRESAGRCPECGKSIE